MDYIQMTLDDWMSIKKELEEELRGAAAGFVRIGYLLRKIDESQGYKQDGCDSLTEWAEQEYGLSASSVSRFMAINKKYSVDGYSKQLRIEYAKYGQAKLQEMLTLPEEDLQMVSPEMKRADIREIKAFERQAPKEEPAEQESDAPQWILEFIKQNGLERLAHTRAFEDRNIAQLIEEVNPTGTKTFRHKRTMVSMFADKIMVKEFPNAPERMEWEEFFEHAIPLIRSMGETEEPETEPEVPEMAQEMPKSEPEMPKVEPKMPEPEPKMPKPVQEVQEEPGQQAEEPIAPAQKEPPTIGNSNVKTDSAIAEEPVPEPTEEPEQVEIDEILPAPEEPDPMRDLKDRFTAELNSLRVMLDCENFSGMAQSIERLKHLRIKMAGMAASKWSED